MIAWPLKTAAGNRQIKHRTSKRMPGHSAPETVESLSRMAFIQRRCLRRVFNAVDDDVVLNDERKILAKHIDQVSERHRQSPAA